MWFRVEAVPTRASLKRGVKHIVTVLISARLPIDQCGVREVTRSSIYLCQSHIFPTAKQELCIPRCNHVRYSDTLMCLDLETSAFVV